MLSSIISWFRSITDAELVWVWRILLLFAATLTALSSMLIAAVIVYAQIQIYLLAQHAGL